MSNNNIIPVRRIFLTEERRKDSRSVPERLFSLPLQKNIELRLEPWLASPVFLAMNSTNNPLGGMAPFNSHPLPYKKQACINCHDAKVIISLLYLERYCGSHRLSPSRSDASSSAA